MRAVIIEQYGEPEVLVARDDIPEPALTAGAVRVQVCATALNRADVLQRQGLYPPPGKKPQHEIPGLEFAGSVSELGEGVSGVAVGDRVCGLLAGGGYAEQVVLDAGMLIPIPDNLSFEQAAAIPEVFITAQDALFTRGRLQGGQTVLVHAGGSGVGTAAIQLAKRAGARVLATFGSEKKLHAAKALGLDEGILYKECNFAERVSELTDGRGADVIVDFIGAAYLEQNISAAAVQGRIVVVGLMGGAKTDINLGLLLGKRLEIIGTVLRARSLAEKIALTQNLVSDLLPAFAQGDLLPVIDSIMPLEQAAEAHRHMESNTNFGKIVLQVQA